jgi:hypothetical protein
VRESDDRVVLLHHFSRARAQEHKDVKYATYRLHVCEQREERRQVVLADRVLAMMTYSVREAVVS